MRTRLAVLALALIGMLLAGSIGYAAYLASRDSVGLPVTKLETQPRDLAPTVARRRTRPRPATTRTVAPPAPPPPPTPVTTVDDHGGGGGGRGGSGSGSGSGSDD